MHGARLLVGLLLASLASACLVERPLPDAPAVTPNRETRETNFPDGSKRCEWSVLVWPDGRIERDGVEREYHPNGALRSEGSFTHGVVTGVWRTWFEDGKPRSEVDHGANGPTAPCTNRFWYANGQLEAEGPAVGGVREGAWHYWNEDGTPLRAGAYLHGQRDGPWSFYDEHGAKRAEGDYALGKRTGSWTLWDEHGEAHARPAAEVKLDDDK